MPPRTRAQKLFGAACLKVSLEKTTGAEASDNDIYRGALEDLGLNAEEVETFLGEHRREVEEALARGRGSS